MAVTLAFIPAAPVVIVAVANPEIFGIEQDRTHLVVLRREDITRVALCDDDRRLGIPLTRINRRVGEH